MTSEIARRKFRRSLRLLAISFSIAGVSACSSFVEVPVNTPLQSKIDVSHFKRILVAGFVTDLVESDVDLSAETSRLLQNQLRTSTQLQVIDPDHPPLHEALEKILEKLGQGGRYTKEERDTYRVEADQALQDQEFWRKIGEEYKNPLIVTGRLAFEQQSRSGFAADERVVRDPSTSSPRLLRGNRFLERKAFSLTADFYFVDGVTGKMLHKEKFQEEVLYSEDQKISPLSSYFELMDRLLPNFLGVISPQKIRGTRVLLE
jgi:hypothetical protein